MKPSKFKTKPYAHQLEGLNKFGRMEAFALLWEMGTGKTWLIINNVADLWASGECDSMLVFAPNGVHSNWTRLELEKHMPGWVRYRAAAWDSGARKKERLEIEGVIASGERTELRVFTMNWEALQSKRGYEAAKAFCESAGSLMIVCDESDAAKNPKAQRTKALEKLKKFSTWRRIMTGTPINNAPFDAFAQYRFLDETILGTTSFYAFKAEYAEMATERHHVVRKIIQNKVRMKPDSIKAMNTALTDMLGILQRNGRDELMMIGTQLREYFECQNWDGMLKGLEQLKGSFAPNTSRGKTKCLCHIAAMETRLARHDRALAAATAPGRLPQIIEKDKDGRPKYRNLDKLSRLMAPHSFRVLKSECLDLPEKIYKTLVFRLTPQQVEVYRKAEEECRIVFAGQETPFNKLVAVTKLAQITSGYYIHPLADGAVRIDGANPKLDLLVDRVRAIREQGDKVIIWARYRVEIADIVARLEAEGLNVVQYHGGVGKEERKETIDSFEHGAADAFVGNQQAGGTGITLVAASYVIYFSNNFSLRDRLQSEDRAHRIGQTKNVTYINLVGQGTIDEHVVRALSNKQDVADTIIDKGLKLFSPA